MDNMGAQCGVQASAGPAKREGISTHTKKKCTPEDGVLGLDFFRQKLPTEDKKQLLPV
jgi:hypothetical protein